MEASPILLALSLCVKIIIIKEVMVVLKKKSIFLLVGLLLLGLVLVFIYTGFKMRKGDVSKVLIKEVASTKYSKEELEDALEVALNYFKTHFNGCVLKEISYVGDEKNKDYIDFATRNGVEDVIVFTSNFDVGFLGGDGSLNRGDTYTNFNWIIVKKDGTWVHVGHGY